MLDATMLGRDGIRLDDKGSDKKRLGGKRLPAQLAIVAASLAVTVALSAPALASFPGRNGEIAFIAHTKRPALYKMSSHPMSPRGSGERLLLRNATAPAYSADGRKILFVPEFNPKLRSGVYTIRPDGSHVHRVPHTVGALDAGFAPDGKRIAFSRLVHPRSRHDFDFDIYTIRLDGSRLRRVTHLGAASRPTFSPNGRWIVFDVTGSVCDIVLIRPGGAHQRFLTEHTSGHVCDMSPDFSPTGHRIVFSRRSSFTHEAIDTITRDGTGLTPIYQAADTVLGDPVFSPTGGRIAFFRRPFSRKFKQIYTMTAEGDHLSQLSHRRVQHDQLSWGNSP